MVEVQEALTFGMEILLKPAMRASLRSGLFLGGRRNDPTMDDICCL